MKNPNINKKDKKTHAEILLAVIVTFVSILYSYPYKEVCSCSGEQCSVKRYYLGKNETYNFARPKRNFVVIHRESGRSLKRHRSVVRFYLYPNIHTNQIIFSFPYRKKESAEEHAKKIESTEDISITRYFLFDIEK